VVVTKRDGPLVRGCLEQLATISHSVGFETIVVLNGCTAHDADALRRDTAGVEVLSTDVNVGFGGALNHARAAVHGDFIVTLHDDARPTAGWLETLVQAAEEQPGAGIVGSLVLGSDGAVQAAGGRLLTGGHMSPTWSGPAPPRERFTARTVVDYTPDCSLLVRRQLWDLIGGADERFFPHAYTDVDLCLAIRARGAHVVCEPASVVTHRQDPSADPTFARFSSERNRRLLLEKWGRLIADQDPGCGATISAPPETLPEQDRRTDAAARERMQLARMAEVSEAFAESLRSQLEAARAELEQLHERLQPGGRIGSAVRRALQRS